MKENILIIDRGRLDGVFRAGFFSQVYKTKKKINVIVLADKLINDKKFKIYKDMGVNEFLYYNIEKKKISNLFLIFLTIFFGIFFTIKFYFYYLNNKVSKLHFKDIKIGDLIIDHHLRFDNFFFEKKTFNWNTINILYSTIFKILLFNKINKKKNINLTIVTSFSYATLSSIAIRFFLKKNIKCVFLGGSKLYVFKRLKDIKNGFFNLKSDIIKNFLKKKNNKKIVEKYYLSRIKPKKITFKKSYMKSMKKEKWDIYRAFQNKKNYSKKELYKVLNFKNFSKPICVFAIHAFKDANHIYGDFLFESFFIEFMKTADFLRDKNNFYWIVKPHPAGDRLGEKNIVEKLIKKNNFNNITVLPNYISTKTILEHADKIVTSRGTVGLEYAAAGKKPIITSNTYYSGFKLAIECKNQKDYFNVLLNENFPRFISKKGTLLAKSILYKRKFEYVKKNIYNLTEPEVETGKKKFLKNYGKKFNQLIQKNNPLRKLYETKMKNEKII